jgi:exodeoxyribonuclease V gamma subunit
MPGIHLYSGNRLETLADAFAELVQTEPLPPFQKETVLIQSRGMARWLATETAARLNIWANCDCPFPNTFIRQIYNLLLPDISTESSFDKDYILWHVMDILPEVMHGSHFDTVASYLESGDDLKLYQLSYEIADLFDQYTLFRPGMILDWEENSKKNPADHAWQSFLWRHLVDRLRKNSRFPEFHRARLLQLFEEKILDPAFDTAILPPRVSVFGISSLPPYHLRVLAALADLIDLHFFIMNPCKEYWFDIIADRDIVKISRLETTDHDTLHLNQGNALLASMGHLGRDFMAMLQELHFEDHELFKDSGNDTLLSNIQQDILYLRENPMSSLEPAPDKKRTDDGDASLIFHSCHSPMREVEILHDQLLEIFDTVNADNSVEPRDILVMAPEINEYAPLIRAVFDAENASHKKIPYTISDQSIRETSKYIETFLNILLLPQSRFTSIDILGILEAEAVKNRFTINDEDLSILENWIRETRICWGVDEDHKTNLQLPPFRENTWRAGLDRLLLGYAMPGHDRVLFENILAYDNIEGNVTSLLGNFLDFTETLFSLTDTLQQPHTLAEWSEILLQTKNKLLLADEKSETVDRVLHQLLYRLRELQNKTFFTKKVTLEVIRSFLIRSLDERFSPVAGGTGFLAGGVTFCSMLPMRAIPFKVICLLGMNDGLYPRSGRRKSFDLMAMEPRRGDRSKRYDDRYLFLETILSARRKLSISFVGQSIQDGSRRPPSVLVSELMNYIDYGYTWQDSRDESFPALSDRLTTIHHLQPFHPDYFNSQTDDRQKNLFSYSAENCEAALALISGHKKTNPVFSAPLPPPPHEFKQVALHDLIRFFSHPARYFLVKIVGIAPIEESQALETSEPFTLQGLPRYKLENDILGFLLRGQDCDKLFHIKKAAGELPHGRTGKIYFTQMVSELQGFYNTLSGVIRGRELKSKHVTLSIGDYTVSGQIDNVGPMGLVQYRYAAIKPKDVIRSWISHLVLNSLSGTAGPEDGVSTFYAGREGIYKFAPAAESLSYLEKLLELYWQGITEPLYFFPQASFAFAREIHKNKNEADALHKAAIAWEGNNFNKKGEKNDPYNLLCCKHMDLANPLFTEQAKTVFLPALAHQEKYRVQILQPGPKNR